MELEEAVDIVKKLNNGYSLTDCEVCGNYNELTGMCDKEKCDELIAIDTVIAELDRLQKENEEFRKLEKDHNYSAQVIRENSKLRYEVAHSVSCDKIREKIDNRILTVEKLLDEMIDKSIGCINTSLLNKKEKEEVINKKNCLTVQMATLEDIKKDLLKEE